ncbi:MAG: uroporphyrinogen-III C-methyltransferase [Betaproteobacteria bacterium]|nr:MAG: uroporphyrinogen-III C-methyltransferase [Betaproteobacteria bacterium]
MTGTVYLVGAGPGAPDLLTLRAAKLLERADIVFHDALVHADTLALAARAVKIAVGKRCGRQSTAQKFINKRLVDAATAYDIVVRLKGGDPMLFGRAHEEIAALELASVRYEVVPGVTAALAAAAEIGTSLTQRGAVRSVTFATPRVGEGEGTNNWSNSIAVADAGAIYMGAGQATSIARELIDAGMPASLPVAIVENASLPDVRVIYTTLAALPAIGNAGIAGPALIFIGKQFSARAAAASQAGLSIARAPARRRG